MEDNSNTREAATVREKSEFLKRVEDFARYMDKEYIGEDEDRVLVVSAGENGIIGSKGGMVHVITGDRRMAVAALVSMMQQEGMDELFRVARINSVADDDMSDAISDKRRRLRYLYIFAAWAVVWSICLVLMCVWLHVSWITTVSNLAVMAFLGYLIVREIRPLCRTIDRLRVNEREERQARKYHEFSEFFGKMRRRMEEDDDD